ncbi:MAG: CAP domain-containing protein [Actinomycetes bacterium]
MRAAKGKRVSYWVKVPIKPAPSGLVQVPSADMVAAADRVVRLTNEARSTGRYCGSVYYPAVPPLQQESHLTAAAYRHSADMAARQYFSHDSLDGRTPWQRIKDAGWSGNGYLGENIAIDNTTANINLWLNSSGHCANIMNRNFRYLGVGVAVYNDFRQYAETQDFAG